MVRGAKRVQVLTIETTKLVSTLFLSICRLAGNAGGVPEFRNLIYWV
jgi:hypothetical protein